MEINERIREVCARKSFRQNDLVLERLGSRQTISGYWHGKQNPNFDFLKGFLKLVPELNARWLLTGEGVMFSGDVSYQTNVAHKSTVGDMNIGSSVSSVPADNNILIENNYLKKEIELKDQIIKDKNEQISLLKELIKK